MPDKIYKVIMNREVISETKCASSSLAFFMHLAGTDNHDVNPDNYKRVIEWNDGTNYMRHTFQCGKM